MDKEPGLQHKWMKDSGEAYLKKTKADVHGSQIKFEGDAVFQVITVYVHHHHNLVLTPSWAVEAI